MLENLFNKIRKRTELPLDKKKNSIPEDGAEPRPLFTPPHLPIWQKGSRVFSHYKIERIDPCPDGGKGYICRHDLLPVSPRLETPNPKLLQTADGVLQIIKRAQLRLKTGLHPNIAASFNLRFNDGVPVMIGEQVAGESLAQWLESGRCGALRSDLSLAIQACHGLEYCYNLGLTHGALSLELLRITPNSLLKICGFGLGYPAESPRDSTPEGDLAAFGLCLWQIFCQNPPSAGGNLNSHPGKPQPLKDGVEFPPSLQVALLRVISSNPAKRYRNIGQLLRDLLNAYQEFFNLPCPYAPPPLDDRQAEILNNQALFLLEEEKVQEASGKLSRSLDLNDTLPEAVHNHLLFHWRFAGTTPGRLLRRIEANLELLPQHPHLLELARAAKGQTTTIKKIISGVGQSTPTFKLVTPPQSLDSFRRPGELNSRREKIKDHLEKRRYQACYEALLELWRERGFRKDRFCNRIYEELLLARRKLHLLHGQRFLSLTGHKGPVSALAVLANSRRIASAGLDGRLIIHDLGGGGRPAMVESIEPAVTVMAASPDGKHLAVGTREGTVHLLALRTGKIAGNEQSHRSPVSSLAFSGDGKVLASGSEEGSIITRRLATGREEAVSLGDSGAIRVLLYPDAGLELISGSEDGTIRHWASRLRECTATVQGHLGAVKALAAAGEGEMIISGGADGRIKIRRRKDLEEQRDLKKEPDPLLSLLALPDGKTLISSADEVLTAWDMERGEKLFSLDGRGGGIHSLAQGPRPHTLLSGRADGTINVWMLIYQLDFDIL